MRHPINIILEWIEEEKDSTGELSQQIIENLYDQKEFEFVIALGNMKTSKYIKKIDELNKQEKDLLFGAWLNEYDNRPKKVNND